MADRRRLAELGMATELAREVAAQIEGAGGGTTWADISGKPAVIAAGADAASARTAIGLGTAATQATGAFATAAQGDLAATAIQPSGLSFAAISAITGDWRGEGSETLLAALTALQSAVSQ